MYFAIPLANVFILDYYITTYFECAILKGKYRYCLKRLDVKTNVLPASIP